MTLGQKLKKARLERGLTQTQVCREHMTRNMLSQLENDLVSPSVRTLEHLSAVLGVSMGWLLEQDPAMERLEEARTLYRDGAFRECFLHLRDSAGDTGEEGILLFILSALRLSEDALADGRSREAREAAALAAQYCDKSLYAGQPERVRANAVLLRCAMEQGADAEALLRSLQSDCVAMGLEECCRILAVRYYLTQGQLPAAQRALQALAEPSADAIGECLVLHGLAEMAQQRWKEAEDFLHQAEAAPRLTRVLRRELYRLLEQCCREREDYRQAYFYASRQIQLEENQA